VTRRRALGLVLAGVLACGDSTAPRTVTGNWTGTAMASASLFQIGVALVDAGGTITGDGSIMGAGIDCPSSIAGTRSGSNVELTFSCTGYTPFTFHASLSKNGQTLTGILNGSGFNSSSFSLDKQH
jgi:hypothetical protein